MGSLRGGKAVRPPRPAFSTSRSHELLDTEFNQVNPALRREVTMVYMFLELSYMASVQRNVELFVDVFDKDGDGHITDVELLTLIKKEIPDDTTLASWQIYATPPALQRAARAPAPSACVGKPAWSDTQYRSNICNTQHSGGMVKA